MSGYFVFFFVAVFFLETFETTARMVDFRAETRLERGAFMAIMDSAWQQKSRDYSRRPDEGSTGAESGFGATGLDDLQWISAGSLHPHIRYPCRREFHRR